MRNVDNACVQITSDKNIKFEENRRKIVFTNRDARSYKKVQVDGCAIVQGERCDNLLTSADENEERFVELKGTDVLHAIHQLERTIQMIGEYEDNRHAYVICTNVAPAYTTQIQKKKILFKQKYKSELVLKEKQHTVALY